MSSQSLGNLLQTVDPADLARNPQIGPYVDSIYVMERRDSRLG